MEAPILLTTPLQSITSSSTATTKQPAKSGRPSLVITLRLPSTLLANLPPPQVKNKVSRSKPSTSNTPIKFAKSSPLEIKSESNSTPIPNGSAEDTPSATTNGLKRKAVGSGTQKVASTSDADAQSKSKVKPGPKRRKLDTDPEGSIKVFGAPAPANARMGPKAKDGIVNAGLRALDRTGKPTRKWHKNGFQVKSFTGHVWGLPTWVAPKLRSFDSNGDSKSDSGSSELKAENEVTSSVLGSDKSSHDKHSRVPNGSMNAANSPVMAMQIDVVAPA